ncbi:hypothetical protein AFLA_010236 [Aspergillus flavus NRRL3357]|nr:hypothetical protein AFLA_010236 [Aspergillus flavus NRRL3357]
MDMGNDFLGFPKLFPCFLKRWYIAPHLRPVNCDVRVYCATSSILKCLVVHRSTNGISGKDNLEPRLPTLGRTRAVLISQSSERNYVISLE